MSTYRDNLRELGKEREYAVTANCVWDVCTWSGDVQHGEEALREAYELLDRTGNKAILSEVAEGPRGGGSGRAASTRQSASANSAKKSVSARTSRVRHTLRFSGRRIRAARGDLAVAEEGARRAIEHLLRNRLSRASRRCMAHARRDPARQGDPGDEAAALEALALFERKGNLVGAGWARAFLEGGGSRGHVARRARVSSDARTPRSAR